MFICAPKNVNQLNEYLANLTLSCGLQEVVTLQIYFQEYTIIDMPIDLSSMNCCNTSRLRLQLIHVKGFYFWQDTAPYVKFPDWVKEIHYQHDI